jgi:hypothetical protein
VASNRTRRPRIRYGGEPFGLLPADDRSLLTDEAALTEWVEQELLAHADA